MWQYVWCNLYSLVKKYYNQSNYTLEYTSKMHTTYLKLYNLHISEKINNKRKAVLEHKKNVWIQNRLIQVIWKKLMAQLKTCNEENIENLYTHYKLYLYELHHLDQKLKTMSYEKEINLVDTIQKC